MNIYVAGRNREWVKAIEAKLVSLGHSVRDDVDDDIALFVMRIDDEIHCRVVGSENPLRVFREERHFFYELYDLAQAAEPEPSTNL